MLFSNRNDFGIQTIPPLGPSGLGVAFFASLVLHAFFLLALSHSPPPPAVEQFGAAIGKAQKGFEVFLTQSASAGREATQERSAQEAPSPHIKTLTAPQSPEKISADAEPKPAPTVLGIAMAEKTTGISQALILPPQPSGRKKGFLGMAKPAGNPDAAMPLAAEWAMRRQAALSNIGPVLAFMRNMYAVNEGVSCTTRQSLVECSNNDPGLMGFLSARYAEAHLIDPSLPAMVWRGHGHGYWSFELQQ